VHGKIPHENKQLKNKFNSFQILLLATTSLVASEPQIRFTWDGQPLSGRGLASMGLQKIMSYFRPSSSQNQGHPQASPYSSHSSPYGAQESPYGAQESPYGAQESPYGAQESPYGAQKSPYGAPKSPFGSHASSYGVRPSQFGAAASSDMYGAHSAPQRRMPSGYPGPSPYYGQQPTGSYRSPIGSSPYGPPTGPSGTTGYASPYASASSVPYDGKSAYHSQYKTPKNPYDMAFHQSYFNPASAGGTGGEMMTVIDTHSFDSDSPDLRDVVAKSMMKNGMKELSGQEATALLKSPEKLYSFATQNVPYNNGAAHSSGQIQITPVYSPQGYNAAPFNIAGVSHATPTVSATSAQVGTKTPTAAPSYSLFNPQPYSTIPYNVVQQPPQQYSGPAIATPAAQFYNVNPQQQLSQQQQYYFPQQSQAYPAVAHTQVLSAVNQNQQQNYVQSPSATGYQVHNSGPAALYSRPVQQGRQTSTAASASTQQVNLVSLTSNSGKNGAQSRSDKDVKSEEKVSSSGEKKE